MEVQLAELGAIKTKLITERNDVAAVVRKEFAENLDRLTDENSRMATELQNQARYDRILGVSICSSFPQQVVAHKAECLEKDLNLRGAKNDFEKNINQLHEKVQMTIEKKEKVQCLLLHFEPDPILLFPKRMQNQPKTNAGDRGAAGSARAGDGEDHAAGVDHHAAER